jgi:hypothetical protein
MPRSSRDYASTFSAFKRNPFSGKSSGELDEMRQLFKSNRESLRQMTHRIVYLRDACAHPHPNLNREFENSPELRRSRVHFAGRVPFHIEMILSCIHLRLQMFPVAVTAETLDGASCNYCMQHLNASPLRNHLLCYSLRHCVLFLINPSMTMRFHILSIGQRLQLALTFSASISECLL